MGRLPQILTRPLYVSGEVAGGETARVNPARYWDTEFNPNYSTDHWGAQILETDQQIHVLCRRPGGNLRER